MDTIEKNWLDKLEQWAKIFSLLAIPVLITLFGNWSQREISKNSTRKDYVDLSISILTSDTLRDKELYDWAIDILANNSPIEMDKELINTLKGNKGLYPKNIISIDEHIINENRFILLIDNIERYYGGGNNPDKKSNADDIYANLKGDYNGRMLKLVLSDTLLYEDYQLICNLRPKLVIVHLNSFLFQKGDNIQDSIKKGKVENHLLKMIQGINKDVPDCNILVYTRMRRNTFFNWTKELGVEKLNNDSFKFNNRVCYIHFLTKPKTYSQHERIQELRDIIGKAIGKD